MMQQATGDNQPAQQQQQMVHQQIIQQPQMVPQQQMLQQQLIQQQQQLLQQQQQLLQQPQQLLQQQQQQMVQQQMMYCPVRVVYDSQVLMPPGDQIQQQNQNLYVNQPPWARSVPNQVIYVQQFGQHLVPIQQFDPNIYVQQNVPYQQMIQVPQVVQNLSQGQIRPVINQPTNMVQNVGSNIQPMQTEQVGQTVGQVVPNYGFIQTNNDVNVPNVNVVSNELDRQVVIANQMAQNASQDAQMQMYRQMTTQMAQQQNVRPQLAVNGQVNLMRHVQQGVPQMAVNVANVNQNNIANVAPNTGANNVQNISTARPNVAEIVPTSINTNVQPHTGPERMNHTLNTQQNAPNVQPNIPNVRPTVNQNVGINNNTVVQHNMSPNVRPIRQMAPKQNMNMVSRNIQHNVANSAVNAVTNTSMHFTGGNINNMNTVTYSAIRNGQPYTYRAIQPKPNNNIRVNFTPRVTQVPMMKKYVGPVPQANANQNNTGPINTVPTAANNVIKTEPENSTFNRKRKSESPDELQKKISNYGSITVTAQVKDKIKAKCAVVTSEIGTNTSPVHRAKHKKVENKPILQINPMETKIKTEFGTVTETTNHVTQLQPNPTTIAKDIVPAMPMKVETPIDFKDKKVLIDVSQQTEEKTVRKTVFPQARGRLLEDKVNITPGNTGTDKMNVDMDNEAVPQHSVVLNKPIVDNNIKVEETKQILDMKTPTNEVATKMEIVESIKKEELTKNNAFTKTDTVFKKEEIKVNNKNQELSTNKILFNILSNSPVKKALEEVSKNDKQELEKKVNVCLEPKLVNNESKPSLTVDKTEELKKETDTVSTDLSKKDEKSSNSKLNDEIPKPTKVSTDFEAVIKDNKIEKKEYTNISIGEMTGSEIHIVDGNIHKEERDFVLTHVLDGYVIQESNVPFAIRKPLREKTINTVTDEKQDPILKNSLTKDEIRDKILELSQLHLEEDRQPKVDEEVDETRLNDDKTESSDGELQIDEDRDVRDEFEEDNKESPFLRLQPSEVKSWTVDTLAAHLTKHNWTETVSILQEHEIDGESLFLVTRPQLVCIGVSEAHADLICEFVQSKS